MLGVTSTIPLFLRSFKDAYKTSDLEPPMMTVNYSPEGSQRRRGMSQGVYQTTA